MIGDLKEFVNDEPYVEAMTKYVVANNPPLKPWQVDFIARVIADQYKRTLMVQIKDIVDNA